MDFLKFCGLSVFVIKNSFEGRFYVLFLSENKYRFVVGVKENFGDGIV